MSKLQSYRAVKNLATELGLNLAPIRAQWRNSTSQYWRNRLSNLQREVRNRNNNYNRALRISRELREPLQTTNVLRGTDNALWKREIRRMRMRARRAPARVQAIQAVTPILRAVQQIPERRRQQQRARILIQEIHTNRADRVKNRRRKVIKSLLLKKANEIKIKKRKEKIVKDLFNELINSNQFNRVISIIINTQNVLTAAQAQIFWNKIQAQGKHIMNVTKSDGTNYNLALNDTTKKWFNDIMMFGTFARSAIGYGSDVIESIHFEDIKKLIITKYVKPTRVINNKSGKFFPYINTTDIDLIEYQIFNQDQAYDDKLTEERDHCLTFTLNKCGIDKALINNVKMAFVQSCSIRKNELKKIASMIKRNINLNYMNSNTECERIYKTKIKADMTNGDDIEIAIYENHYFKFEETKYSKYCINNYDNVKGEKVFENIFKKSKGKYYERNPNKYKINSLFMIHRLFVQGYFKKLDLVKFEEAARHVDLKNHIYLDNIENEQRECKNIKPVKEKFNVFYADCETYVNGPFHTLQLLGVVNDESDLVDIMNINDPAYKHDEVSTEQMVVNRFMSILTKNGKQNALCYFHNLKYDYHVLEQYIDIEDRCEKDNSLYSVKIKYKKCVIELRDSYKLLPFALAEFQSNFNLPTEFGKKEAIAYDYYTLENDNKRINIMDYCNRLDTDQQLIFLKNMNTEPSYDKVTNTFNPMDYYKEYLRLDCLVLKKGIQKFDALIGEITQDKMSVYDCLTISSLTDKYMRIEGAYDGVYEVLGNLRAYIAKAVYGGRVCVNEKYQKKTIEGKISDYDGVSLYPSAINRLCRKSSFGESKNDGGLPMGKARRLLAEQFNEWDKMTYSILTVKITKVNKIQQMPFIACKDPDGSLRYTNEPPTEPIIIDSITLQDYIKFHQIEYEIKDGVYWNNGGNTKMGEVVRRLFQARLKEKKTNPALGNTIKLMLNSAYGKTIMKKTTTEKKIVSASKKTYDEKTGKWINHKNSRFESYIYNNFNTIRTFRKLNENNYEVEKICSDNSYNRGHIGCAILSMSKRIMNELFNVANDLDKPIYYTDTDSLHCNFADIPAIETEYEKRYNKVLTGVSLEQFHTDFSLKGAGRDSEIYATKSIFLGKKSYIDLLESTDKDGKTITGYHIRLKGITEAGLEHTAKSYSDDKKNPEYFKMYEDLALGTVKKIILNPFNPDKNKNKVLFEFKNGQVSTRKEFTRDVNFGEKKRKK
jgi:hypothetical protein